MGTFDVDVALAGAKHVARAGVDELAIVAVNGPVARILRVFSRIFHICSDDGIVA